MKINLPILFIFFLSILLMGCTCAGNGKHLSDVAGEGSRSCCAGLETISSVYVDSDTGECAVGAESPRCTDTRCGDGKCDSPENKCNCEKDCK